MASLVKRGKYYHGVISINGKQVWRSLRTGDPVEAEKRLAELEARYGGKVEFPKGNITLREFYDLWMHRHVKLALKPTSESRYRGVFYNHVLPVLGEVRMCDLTVGHFQDLLVAMKDAGLSDTSLRNNMKMLQGMLSVAEDWGYVEYNMAKKVKLPASRRPKVHPWSPEEAARFLKSTERHPLYPMWVTAILTGMRRGELCGLRWQNVDFRLGVIHVVWQITTMDNGIAVELPVKTEDSHRTVSMGPYLREFLLRHKEAVDIWKRSHHPIWDYERDLVFPHINQRNPEKTGSYWHPDLVHYHFKRQCKLVGVRVIRFHDLRHTHFTYLSEAGVPLAVISERAGHSSVQTTGDLYTHPSSRAHDEAARTGEGFLIANGVLSNPLAEG